jgi:hypothetical protein
MATYSKSLLSGSVNGKQIVITATTSGSATPLHTAVSGTGSLDEIYLYAYNDATASVLTNVLWGSAVEPDGVVRFTLPSRVGRTLIVDGKLLQNSLTVSAYASVANVIMFDGFVNNIAP